MKSQPAKPFFSFSQKLFLAVMLLFITYAATFLIYQYEREKLYKTTLLDTTLQDLNDRLYDELEMDSEINDSIIKKTFDTYLKKHIKDSLRVSVILLNGKVIYDSKHSDIIQMGDHSQRAEVSQTIKTGRGFDIRRTSQSTGVDYFYSAKLYDNYIIRSALPYNVELRKNLRADSHFIWFTLIATIILAFLFYQYTRSLNKSFIQLKRFATKAEKDNPIDLDNQISFPNNELGEISEHIIRIYKRLHKTKEALRIEQEKIFAHFQTSREGLGIFNPDKSEIFVNRLFIQYCHLISDVNLSKTEDFFAVPEVKSITDFIESNSLKPFITSEKRDSLSIYKNGKSFNIECIIFQDRSFEISIIDITSEKEQTDIKRQLTQNAAHELKTPVSSIQGYLETIVNNKNINEEKKNEFLLRCYSQSSRLSHLLRDISALTRMEESANMIDMEQINVTTIIDNILNDAEEDLKKKDMQINNKIDKDLFIRGNNSLIYSIFHNLTDNAIAYAGEGTTITISCFREDEDLFYFSFSDNGNGIAAEHLNRIFERFYRVDKGRSRKLGGTGLGLSIVKNAIIIHGGDISAKNSQAGGLEFVFTLAKGG